MGWARPAAAAFALFVSTVLFFGCHRAPRPSNAPFPQRVVTLAPNLTEIVFAVGAGDRLVGVSEYSDYPPAAQQIPRVGGLEVSAERVASLTPDLVIATPEGNAKGPVMALAAAGIPVIVAPGGSLGQVLESIRSIGRRLGRAQEAERLIERLAAQREEARKLGRTHPLRRAVLLVWPDPPQGAGKSTFGDDILSEAGAVNLLGDRSGWPVVSAEWLSTTPIEVLVLPDSAQTRPAYDRAMSSGPLSRGTVSRARVVRIEESVLTRPGPRAFDALSQLSRELAR